MPKTPTLTSPDGNHTMTLLPPAAGKCQTCATAHEPEMPHNAQSLYYQMAFKMKHGRDATWNDAMSHCTPAMKRTWGVLLKEAGASLAGNVSPKKKSHAKKA